MRFLLRSSLLLLTLALALPGFGADKNNNKPTNTDKANDADYKVLANNREVVGKLLGSDGKSVSIRIEYQTPEVNGNAPRPNFNPRAVRRPQVRLVTHHKDFDLPLTPDVQLRSNDLPTAFDEKGFPKVYTAQEKKELKGDASLPGYKAALEDLKNGQMVKLSLVRPKPPEKGADKNLADNRPLVSRVVILADGNPVRMPGDKKK